MKGVILGGVDAAVGALEKTIGYTSNFGTFLKTNICSNEIKEKYGI